MDFLKNIKFAQFATQDSNRPNMPPSSFQQTPPPPPPPTPTIPPTKNVNPPYMVSGGPEEHKGGIFKLISIIVTIVVVIVVATGAVLATRVWDPLWSPFRPSPEKVLENMITKMQEVKTSHGKVVFEMSASDTNSKQGAKVSATIEGDGDSTDNINPKGNVDFKISVIPSGTATAFLPSNLSVKGKIVSTGKDNTMYFKLDEFNLSSILGEDGAIFDEVKGQWLKINNDIIKNLGGEIGDIDVTQAANQELTKKIQDEFLKSGLFEVSNQLSDETVQGKPAYHYVVKIGKDKLVSLISDLAKSQLDEELKKQEAAGEVGGEAVMAMAQGMMKGMLTEFMNKIGDLEADLYIGKNDYLLYVVNFEKSFDLSKIDKAMNAQISIKINTENSEFGKTVSISEPKESISIDEILKPFIEAQKEMMKMEQVGMDMNEIISLGDSIFESDKTYYSICSKGLLNGSQKLQGAKLLELNNDIVSQGGEKPKCFSAAKSYCVSTKFSGTGICVDSTGGFVEGVECTSAKGCPQLDAIKIQKTL